MSVRDIVIGAAVVLAVGYVVYWSMQNSSEIVLTEEKSAETQTTSKPVVQEKTAATQKAAPATPSAPTPAAPASTRFCPKFYAGAQLGSSDGPQSNPGVPGTTANLQTFLVSHYGLSKDIVTGTFDSQTETYLKRYQGEEGLPQTGVLNSESQQKMWAPCVQGLTANGGPYVKRNFTFSAGSVTLTASARESLQDAAGSLENGALRIEVVSISGGVAQLRVTGGVIGGIETQRFSLAKGEKKSTNHWPKGLIVEATNVSGSSATLTISSQTN